MKIIAGLKAAANAAATAMAEGPKAQSFHTKGIQISCPLCKNVLFYRKSAELKDPLRTLDGPDWIEPLVCGHCARIELFYHELTPDPESGNPAMQGPSSF